MGGRPVGVIGLRIGNAVGEVEQIGVDAARRGQGVGRAMIEGLSALRPTIRSWTAETDDDAVGCYRSLGFTIGGLGELYPGVRRYRCVLDGADLSGSR